MAVGATARLSARVCVRDIRGKPLLARRRLLGAPDAEFADQELEFTDSRCVFLDDVIPENTLRPGFFRYHVRILDGARQLAEAYRVFSTVDH